MDSSNTTAMLQTAIAPQTHIYLRLEALRRHLTMGQLVDEIILRNCLQSADIPKTLPN